MYRAFHAPIRTNEGTLLRNAQGLPTNAVYIFVTMLRKLLKEHAPEFIAASFDLPGPTFRDDLAADYKANRRPMPDELAAQIPLVHRACEALGVPIVTVDRYEADDVIGTMARRGVAEGYDVVIITGDKDFFQLVGPAVRVFNPREDGTWYDEAGVKEKFGVAPGHVIDVLALMGDTIDNVKGVPGIGEKGARELISTYGSLDALLERAADVPQKKYREALLANADAARSSRELVTIHTGVAVEFDLQTFRYRGPSREACYALFSELGFRSLTTEFAPTADTTTTDYRAVTTSAELQALVEELRGVTRLAVAIVADERAARDGEGAFGAMAATIVGLVISAAPGTARYVPVATPGRAAPALLDDPLPPALSLRDVVMALTPVLEDRAVEKVGHDLKFVSLVLAEQGVRLDGLGLDTMLGSYLLDATGGAHSLEGAALEHLGYKALTEDDVRGRGAKAVPFAGAPAERVLSYAGERVDLAIQLDARLAPLLVDHGLDRVYREIERPLIPVLVAMERAGVRVDAVALAAQSQHVDRELAVRSAQIFELAGESFNVNSPKQLSEILFDKLQLPVSKRNVKTKTASTAVDVLEELALVHELPRLILEWRALQKLKGTYIDALPQLVHPKTGRVHTSFNQAVAATGRLSSSDPNLQNIPIRTPLGREIRRAFVADPGHVLISADYSQIELRVLAHLSGDETLVQSFRDGRDIHEQTAERVFGPASGLDPHERRSRAKMINYALLYGKTAFTLSKDIGVTPQAAQEFIDAYFAGFPSVRAFIDRTLEDARVSGVVKTLFGRRRLVPELTSRNQQIRSGAERAAVNMPIQGTAADIMKRAMIDVHQGLARVPGARMILTVHDELLFEVPEARAEDVRTLVQHLMQEAVPLNVPLTVDVGIGANWKDAKPQPTVSSVP